MKALYENNRELTPCLLCEVVGVGAGRQCADGRFRWWIDVGAPSAERLHKASKTSEHVALYSAVRLAQLRREARRTKIFRLEDIEVWPLPGELLDELGERTKRSMKLDIARTEEHVYLTLDGATFETPVERTHLPAH